MGVRWEHYIIVGIKTEFKAIEKLFNIGEFEDLKLDGVVDQWSDPNIGDFVYISDGMNGNYDILGKIVQMGLENEGLDMTDCLAFYEKHQVEVSEKLHQLGINLGKISVFAFTHFH